jgi:hypothetical protein
VNRYTHRRQDGLSGIVSPGAHRARLSAEQSSVMVSPIVDDSKDERGFAAAFLRPFTESPLSDAAPRRDKCPKTAQMMPQYVGRRQHGSGPQRKTGGDAYPLRQPRHTPPARTLRLVARCLVRPRALSERRLPATRQAGRHRRPAHHQGTGAAGRGRAAPKGCHAGDRCVPGCAARPGGLCAERLENARVRPDTAHGCWRTWLVSRGRTGHTPSIANRVPERESIPDTSNSGQIGGGHRARVGIRARASSVFECVRPAAASAACRPEGACARLGRQRRDESEAAVFRRTNAAALLAPGSSHRSRAAKGPIPATRRRRGAELRKVLTVIVRMRQHRQQPVHDR